MLFCFSSLYPQILDKFYIYTSLNKNIGAIQKKTLSSGLLIGTKFVIPDTRTKIFLSMYINSIENLIDDNSTLNTNIKEFYIQKNINNININIGRQIIDLSTSNIYSINDFISPITSIIDLYDSSLQQIGLDGITIIKNIESINAKAILYIYTNNIILDKNDRYRTILNLHGFTNELSYDIFVGFDKYHNKFISDSISLKINPLVNVYMENKYQDDRYDYVVGFDTTFMNNIDIALERFYLHSQNNNILFIDNKRMINGDYLSLFLRMPIYPNVILSLIGIHNIHSKNNIFISKIDYSIFGLQTSFEYMYDALSYNTQDDNKISNIFKLNFSINLISPNNQ
jgi:uncharacterized protein (UPF0335 family)